MKILILASNPRKDLSLDREIRDLTGVIERSHHHKDFEVVNELAVRVSDLQEVLLKHRPQIVHFCGHGSGKQGLVFESDSGGEQWVGADALSSLFKLFASHTECVLLNACYSEEQASTIVDHINYVIGMNQAIQDNAAIAFSKGFYRALGYKCSIEQAYEFGCNAIQLEISGSSTVRSVFPEQQRKIEIIGAVKDVAIPEHLKPVLKRKSVLTVGSPAGVSGFRQPLSSEAQVAIQVDVDKALEEEATSLTCYRNEVKRYLTNRSLEAHEQVLLDQLRDELGLSVEETNQILEEEQAPIETAKKVYKRRLVALIESDLYPFNPSIKTELSKFQVEKGLTNEEIDEISRPILDQAKIANDSRVRNSAPAIQRQASCQIKLLVGGAGLLSLISSIVIATNTTNSAPGEGVIPAAPAGQCIANVSNGNIRTEPTDRAGDQSVINNNIQTKNLPVSGISAGDWVQLQLPDGKVGWAHFDAISNDAEVESCLTQSVNAEEYYIENQPAESPNPEPSEESPEEPTEDSPEEPPTDSTPPTDPTLPPEPTPTPTPPTDTTSEAPKL
jgi:hypothetical protein